MKRIHWLKSVMIFGLILGTSVVLAERGRKNVGIINLLEGSVQNFHEWKTEAEVMETGSKVYINDRIVTRKDSKAQIVFRDDSAVTLGPETELVIDVSSYNIITGKFEVPMVIEVFNASTKRTTIQIQ